MHRFMDKNFLLTTQTARLLYHLYAAKLPVIESFSHLSAEEIAQDKQYSNIGELLLRGDRVKASLRACGVEAHYITGEASDYEKFRALCRAMPSLIGNPNYLLCHLALQRGFACTLPLNAQNCDAIWSLTAERLSDPIFSARGMLTQAKIDRLAIAEPPTAMLEAYAVIAEDNYFKMKVEPIFAPDLALDRPGAAARLRKLGETNGVAVTDLASLEAALTAALNRFAAHGCRSAYHSIAIPHFVRPDPYHADQALKAALTSDGREVTDEQTACFGAQMLRFLGREYLRRGWVLQARITSPSSDLLAYLRAESALPRTLLHTGTAIEGTAIDNAPSIAQVLVWEEGMHPDMIAHRLRGIAAHAALGRFIGMASAADSPLAFPRHEYFRRVLCRTLGEWVEAGLYPADMDALAQLVCDVCYNNAKNV